MCQDGMSPEMPQEAPKGAIPPSSDKCKRRISIEITITDILQPKVRTLVHNLADIVEKDSVEVEVGPVVSCVSKAGVDKYIIRRVQYISVVVSDEVQEAAVLKCISVTREMWDVPEIRFRLENCE